MPSPTLVHRVTQLRWPDIGGHRGFCVTSPARTLVDLCGCVDVGTVEASFDRFRNRKLLAFEKLEDCIERLMNRGGLGSLVALLERYRIGEPPTESELESRALELIALARLPRPKKQAWVPTQRGNRRLDLFWEQQEVVVEVDGRVVHFNPEAQEADIARDNAIVVARRGFSIQHWTHAAMKARPAQLVEDLAGLLGVTADVSAFAAQNT